MIRTSVTHPLQIAEIAAAEGCGLIGITFCPGKLDPHAATGSWNRDLVADLDRVRDWGAAAVITLLEAHELTLLRVERLGEEVKRRNMRWFHLPICDVSTPDERFEHAWQHAGEELRSLLRRQLNVLVHCRGGLGRAGTVAARLLVEFGMSPAEAIAKVRAIRPGAIQTSEQERFVFGLPLRSVEQKVEAMDWFEKLTGFAETNYDETRAKLRVTGDRLHSLVNDKSYAIGTLELARLDDLRQRVDADFHARRPDVGIESFAITQCQAISEHQ